MMYNISFKGESEKRYKVKYCADRKLGHLIISRIKFDGQVSTNLSQASLLKAERH